MSDLENKKNPVVITIARDFGAEGHEIGRMLADELGIPLHDNELLVRASLRAGESLDKMAAYDERLAVENMAFLPDRYDARSYSDKLFQKMSQVILDLGETESFRPHSIEFPRKRIHFTKKTQPLPFPTNAGKEDCIF